MQAFEDLQIVVLAAGQGKRMRSRLPKVLHPVLGWPMLAHVLHAAEQLAPAGIAVVVGEHAAQIRAALGDPANVRWARQEKPRGTGDAVAASLACWEANIVDVLVLCGDTPLVSSALLRSLVEARRKHEAALALAVMRPQDPRGYGRIVRDADGTIARVVEEADADAKVRAIAEVNAGIYCFAADFLRAQISRLSADNAQGELYLPDLVALARKQQRAVVAVEVAEEEALGVNDRVQLARAERILQRRIIQEWQRKGVTIEQPETVRIEMGVAIGEDTVIHAGCQLLGEVHIGDGCELGPYAVLRDVWLDDGVRVLPFSVLEGPETELAAGARVGPFARLRPGARLGEDVRVGNFVEVKNSVLGRGTKANHLTYLGDAEIGEGCNIGAGTITCNYDGANKHKTVIEDDVFVGSDTKLIAPVRVGKGATIGAGSIITKDVPPGGLTLSARVEQRHFPDWRRPRKKK